MDTRPETTTGSMPQLRNSRTPPSAATALSAEKSQEWTLARGIVKLVHGLGLETIAEGVERADQVAHLRALGCRLAQGYYFARPMAEPGVEEFLENAESRPASVQRG